MNVIVAADQINDGGLTYTGMTYKCNLLTGLHFKADAFQYPILIIISKPYIFKFYCTVYGAAMASYFRIFSFFFIQDLINTIGRYQRRLNGSIFFSQIIDRLKELFYIISKGIQHTNFQIAPGDASTAVYDQQRNYHVINYFHSRTQERVQKYLSHGSFKVCFIQFTEFLQFMFLAIEGLNDSHTGNIFCHKAVDLTNDRLHLFPISLDHTF